MRNDATSRNIKPEHHALMMRLKCFTKDLIILQEEKMAHGISASVQRNWL